MKLLNFTISSNGITLEQDGEYYDLHNDFGFIGFNYNIFSRTIELKWVFRDSECSFKNSPHKITLKLVEVYFFKVKERHKGCPFTEDDCLSNIGFHWIEAFENDNGDYPQQESEICTYLTLEFQSEFALKIGSESASLISSKSHDKAMILMEESSNVE